jgi:hypothetical protein
MIVFAVIIASATGGFVYWRLHKSNMDIPPGVETPQD